jgi:hypothetical protein
MSIIRLLTSKKTHTLELLPDIPVQMIIYLTCSNRVMFKPDDVVSFEVGAEVKRITWLIL